MRPKTLLIEDNEAVRGVLSRAFAKDGWDVHSSATPSAAIAVASVDHFDVIVSDVFLPEMTGFRLADRLSALQPHAGVIFISGYPPDMMDEANGQRVLQKPFRPKELITLADRLVRRRSGATDFQRLAVFNRTSNGRSCRLAGESRLSQPGCGTYLRRLLSCLRVKRSPAMSASFFVALQRLSWRSRLMASEWVSKLSEYARRTGRRAAVNLVARPLLWALRRAAKSSV